MTDQLSPFPEWEVLRAEIAPLIGERAVSLLAFAVFDACGGTVGAAYFRQLLRESGTDVDAAEVTEAEALMIRWARVLVGDGGLMTPEFKAQFDATFSPPLREKLAEFVGLTFSTATAQRS